jgi:glutamate-1-semialdehyde aminotransferase/tRNA C32,U32 (ribose-2'-O)-methylase TrmJ
VRVAAFTGRRRAAKWARATPREAAGRPRRRTRAGGPVAVLFGREDDGLPSDAVDRAQLAVTIPTTEHISLNVAQAVLVALYELHLAAGDATRTVGRWRKHAGPAPGEATEQYFRDAERALATLDFFKTRNPEHVMRSVRALTFRAAPDARELGLMRAMAFEVVRTVERESARARAEGFAAGRAAPAGDAAPRRAPPPRRRPAARRGRRRGGCLTACRPMRRRRGLARPRRARGVAGGGEHGEQAPARPVRAGRAGRRAAPLRARRGCRVTTASGRTLVDATMALGRRRPRATPTRRHRGVQAAAADGPGPASRTCGEPALAERLCELVPCAERALFLKSGAEAVAAAVRLAARATGRDRVVGAGYFGWLDWWSTGPGVPAGASADYTPVPWGDAAALEAAVDAAGGALAAVVLEPVVEREPPPGYLARARALATRAGAVLVFDEVKLGCRLHPGGYQAVCGVTPDLAVFGKALANGYPLAAVVGGAAVMDAARRAWISSTLASEGAALAAAHAVLDRHAREDVCAALARTGARLRAAVAGAAGASGVGGVAVVGLDAMFFLRFADAGAAPATPARPRSSPRPATPACCSSAGAYDYAALAHDDDAVDAVGRAAAAGFAAVRALDGGGRVIAGPTAGYAARTRGRAGGGGRGARRRGARGGATRGGGARAPDPRRSPRRSSTRTRTSSTPPPRAPTGRRSTPPACAPASASGSPGTSRRCSGRGASRRPPTSPAPTTSR